MSAKSRKARAKWAKLRKHVQLEHLTTDLYDRPMSSLAAAVQELQSSNALKSAGSALSSDKSGAP